jgi:aromatic-L-amino-acid decarboxylase
MRAMKHPLEPTAAEMDALTAACVAFVREHIGTLAEQPASDVDGAVELAKTFVDGVPETGAPIDALLDRLRPAIAKTLTTAGPGYLAFIPGGGIYAAAIADYIACAVNRYVGVTKVAPALAQIERTAIRWLADFMGYPPGARGVLTSGGSMANFIAVVTARTERLPEDFLRGTIYTSEHTHLSVAKAARFAGFPAKNVRSVAVDARLRLDPGSLARMVADDRAAGFSPFMVVTNIGTTNTGAIDPTPAILDVAARERLWVHADAAYGGFFRIAPGGEALMPGIDRCDSITLDPHKGLFLPYGTGCVLVRDGDALRRAHESDAAYLADVRADGGEADFTDMSPELSRDFRGLRLWLPMMLHGAGAWREQLGEKLRLAREAYETLAADARFDVLEEPQLSVVAFRLRTPGKSGEEADALNAELLQRVNARKRVFMSSTVLHGRLTLRICVLSFRTHEDRVRDAVDALREEARALVG